MGGTSANSADTGTARALLLLRLNQRPEGDAPELALPASARRGTSGASRAAESVEVWPTSSTLGRAMSYSGYANSAFSDFERARIALARAVRTGRRRGASGARHDASRTSSEGGGDVIVRRSSRQRSQVGAGHRELATREQACDSIGTNCRTARWRPPARHLAAFQAASYPEMPRARDDPTGAADEVARTPREGVIMSLVEHSVAQAIGALR